MTSRSKSRTTSARRGTALLYVYGAAAGAPAPRAVASLPTLPGAAPPRVVPLTTGISLLAADVPAAIYETEAIAPHLTDLDWVGRAGAAHHEVIDRVAETHVVVPFRLFTLFSSEAKALATLRAAKKDVRAALDRVKGRAEWVLRIGRPDPAKAAAPVETARTAVASGTGFLQAKAAARRSARDRAEHVRAGVTRLFDTLASLADEADARPIQPGAPALLDAAFLVPKRKTGAFKKALTASAADLLAAGCSVALTGPWPPYSFVSLDSTNDRG